MKRARAGMNDEEAQFSVEVQLKPEASIWSDKYKPRKPRFFNRVHTVCWQSLIIIMYSGSLCFIIVIIYYY